ncbi:MAG: hydrogenase nickel incorporation protein HypB [Candidatus Eisenbacteria bacterium]|nr:hydrogenase nickel incorporation protein HypB [Candidatus Latescibacterota bacterium]MBD3303284.1 hydrogenase nickel incorporation protein HypB [Candidatus Eisenbacteria bacterium]
MNTGKIRVLDLQRSVTAKNDEIAAALRDRFRRNGLFVVNLLSGPGAGKTTLLEKTVQALEGKLRCLVLEGDLRTTNDADRIAGSGADAIQIVTNGVCHLDSKMITSALEGVELDAYDAVVIENVGNLVCPNSFDLGETVRVVVSSVPEGEDKPAKYPFLFEGAEVVLLNKIDLLPHTPFDKEAFWSAIGRVNRSVLRLETSCTTGMGLDGWLRWFQGRAAEWKTAGRETE